MQLLVITIDPVTNIAILNNARGNRAVGGGTWKGNLEHAVSWAVRTAVENASPETLARGLRLAVSGQYPNQTVAVVEVAYV